MTLENVLSPSDIFHPAVFYDDDWILGGMEGSRQFLQDNLYINSKVKNGKNLYLEFLEKYYYQPLTNYFDSEALSHLFYPKILLTSNPQVYVKFDFI